MAIAGSFDRQSLSSLQGVRQSQAMFRACLVACALAFGSPFAQTQVFAEEGDLSVLAIDASFAVAIKADSAPPVLSPAQRREIREYFSCVARVLVCEPATLRIASCREAWNCWNAASAAGCVPW